MKERLHRTGQEAIVYTSFTTLDELLTHLNIMCPDLKITCMGKPAVLSHVASIVPGKDPVYFDIIPADALPKEALDD